MIKCSVSSISIILLTTILWNIWNVSLFVHAIYTYNAISKRKKKHFQSSVLSLIRCVWMGGSLNVVRECYYYYWQSFWCIQFIYRILKYFPTFYNSVLLYLLSWVGFVSFIYFFFFFADEHSSWIQWIIHLVYSSDISSIFLIFDINYHLIELTISFRINNHKVLYCFVRVC